MKHFLNARKIISEETFNHYTLNHCVIVSTSSYLLLLWELRLWMTSNVSILNSMFLLNSLFRQIYNSFSIDVRPLGITVTDVVSCLYLSFTASIWWTWNEYHTNIDGLWNMAPFLLFHILCSHSKMILLSIYPFS